LEAGGRTNLNKLGPLLGRRQRSKDEYAKKTLMGEVTEFIRAKKRQNFSDALSVLLLLRVLIFSPPPPSSPSRPVRSSLNELPPNCRIPALSSILIVPSLATTMPSRSAVMMEESANPSSSSHAPSSMNQFRALLWKNAIAKTRTPKVRTKCRRLPSSRATHWQPASSCQVRRFSNPSSNFSFLPILHSSLCTLHTPQPIPQLIPNSFPNLDNVLRDFLSRTDDHGAGVRLQPLRDYHDQL
jgi:hypothetical protein